jgi:hypothetical protein
MEELTLQVQRDERSGSRGMVGRIQVERAASRRKGKTSRFCSSRSRRRSQLTLMKAPLLAESEYTS